MALTVLQAFESVYLIRRNLSSRAAVSHRSNLRRWETLVGAPPIDRIDETAFDAFRAAAKAAGYSADSIEGSVNGVLRVLRDCARPKVGLLAGVPEAGQRLKVSTRVRYTPPLADLGKAYQAADVARWPCRGDAAAFWRAVFVAALWTAFRRSDLLHELGWECFGDEAITLTAHKTGKVHVLPASPVVLRHLDPMRSLDAKRVFPVGKCNHQILREIHRIADAAGVKRFGLQSLRRRSCSNWQAAKWGAGEVVQGSAIRGSAVRYIVPEILQQAAPRFQWPAEMLTAAERDRATQEEARLLAAVKRLGESERTAVLSLAERLAT